ncbi:MAG: response regulator transcription factor [Chitinophagaceae bacterium]
MSVKNLLIKIALVEDNVINKNTFHQKMCEYKELDLGLEASDGHEFLEKMKGLPQHEHPQVVFMDIEMPGLNGIETTKLSKALYPEMPIIVLTVFEDNDNIFEAIRGGASGYLLKHESNTSIRNAITEVLEYGGAPMSPAIARKTLQLLSSGNATATASGTTLDHFLSEREREILKYTVNGWDAKRISSQLFISVLTVRKHIANIYVKLHVNSKAQIISLAHKNHWFS